MTTPTRDDDGDGIREVHDKTMEGLWLALRTLPRPFRGISKHYLHQHVAVFQWAYNRLGAAGMIRTLLGLPLTPRRPREQAPQSQQSPSKK